MFEQAGVEAPGGDGRTTQEARSRLRDSPDRVQHDRGEWWAEGLWLPLVVGFLIEVSPRWRIVTSSSFMSGCCCPRRAIGCCVREECDMGFTVEGDYFEACSCAVSCPCVFLGPATEDACDLFCAWRVERGEKDGVDLAGLNAALAVHTPKQMTDGNWRVALYLDDRASSEQREALGAIFSGQAGGHLANLVPLIAEVAGVEAVPIEFESSNGKGSVRVGSVLTVRAEQSVGMDGEKPSVITNPPFGAVAQPVRQGRSTEVRYDGAWSFSTQERNAFFTEFAYSG
ncbi:DUF1326 domain-containing protein [Saccharopolyspora sp. ASAGF58]|nr:DUF1326 domain-containing protein [Saccharopolyspora sp. ASAGF58]